MDIFILLNFAHSRPVHKLLKEYDCSGYHKSKPSIRSLSHKRFYVKTTKRMYIWTVAHSTWPSLQNDATSLCSVEWLTLQHLKKYCYVKKFTKITKMVTLHGNMYTYRILHVVKPSFESRVLNTNKQRHKLKAVRR
jgi:hypothetical protein